MREFMDAHWVVQDDGSRVWYSPTPSEFLDLMILWSGLDRDTARRLLYPTYDEKVASGWNPDEEDE